MILRGLFCPGRWMSLKNESWHLMARNTLALSLMSWKSVTATHIVLPSWPPNSPNQVVHPQFQFTKSYFLTFSEQFNTVLMTSLGMQTSENCYLSRLARAGPRNCLFLPLEAKSGIYEWPHCHITWNSNINLKFRPFFQKKAFYITHMSTKTFILRPKFSVGLFK